MSWSNLLSDTIRPVLRPFRGVLTPHTKDAKDGGQRCREELHEYWKAPDDGSNAPQDYFAPEPRSKFLISLIEKNIGHDAAVLEIGCNVGRNLHFLYQAGFENLSAIEISENAVKLLRESYPETAARATIHNRPVEDVIKTFDDGRFDVVFSMAVLEHIHTDSEWIFGEMVRASGRLLITIEDEKCLSSRHFPRNYRKIFEPLGMRQIEEITCSGAAEGLSKNFVARVFVKDAG